MTTTMTTQQLIAQIEALKLQNETLWDLMPRLTDDNIIEFIVADIGHEDTYDIFPREWKLWIVDEDQGGIDIDALITLQRAFRRRRVKKDLSPESDDDVEDDSVTYEGWKNETAFSSINTASWSKQSVKLLKRVCKERGLKKYSKLKKEELLRMLYLDEYSDPVDHCYCSDYLQELVVSAQTILDN